VPLLVSLLVSLLVLQLVMLLKLRLVLALHPIPPPLHGIRGAHPGRPPESACLPVR
jgi:hypothetical protein